MHLGLLSFEGKQLILREKEGGGPVSRQASKGKDPKRRGPLTQFAYFYPSLFCRTKFEYFQNYVAFVTVDGPSSAVILTERDKSLDFYVVLSTLGGHFGLFAGMSVLGMAEIVILIITMFYRICKKIVSPFQIIQEIDEPNYNQKIDLMASSIKVSSSDV